MTKNTPIAEQIIIENETTKSTQTQLQASDILKTKQLIPHNFIQLETKGKNYMCSTEGWKEPICERFGFTYEGKWVQLDIPHTLVEKLELKKGESISYPVYISSELLNKEPEFGGITLEKEEEVFLLKPLTKDEEVQTEVSGERIEELEKQNKEKDKQIAQLNQKVGEQARRIGELERQITGVGHSSYFDKWVKDFGSNDWNDPQNWLNGNINATSFKDFFISNIDSFGGWVTSNKSDAIQRINKGNEERMTQILREKFIKGIFNDSVDEINVFLIGCSHPAIVRHSAGRGLTRAFLEYFMKTLANK